jgi:hypothetical protein
MQPLKNDITDSRLSRVQKPFVLSKIGREAHFGPCGQEQLCDDPITWGVPRLVYVTPEESCWTKGWAMWPA